jgi:RNA polymerase sigma factor (sigma-70 family)
MRTEEVVVPRPVDWPAARERCLREAQRYTRCPLEAEDVVQEALLRAWKTRSTLRNAGQPLPWLLQITRNEALRSLSRTQRDRDRCALVPEPEAPAAPGDAAETCAAKVDVERALRHLAAEEREMVNLRYREELTHSTIADLMSIPVGTCKVRLHRLRKRLSVLLAEEVPA